MLLRASVVALVWIACSAPARVRTFEEPTAELGLSRPEAPRRLAAYRTPPSPPPFRLSRDFVPRSHAVSLSLHHQRFDGSIAITGDVTAPIDVIWLHAIDMEFYRATASRQGETRELAVATLPDKELVALMPETLLAADRWTVTIEYAGKVDDHGDVTSAAARGDPLPRASGVFSQAFEGRRYFFTNFEPMDARRAFPCIDEPDRKIPWQLTLEVDADDVVASNTRIIEETLRPFYRKRVQFAQTNPLPSYVVAFAVGDFEVVTDRQRTPFRMLVPPGDADAARRFVRWPRVILDDLEAWLKIPYAYDKLDFVAVPRTGVGWGAMENPGLITFDRSYLDDEESFVSMAVHELAHQWFGNLVTLRWWDDIWLNEGFARWMERKLAPGYVAQLGPRTPPPPPTAAQISAWRNRPPPGDTIRVPARKVESRAELARYFDGGRGADLLEKLERQIGAPAFQRAVRHYVSGHVHGVATSDDFAGALTAITGRSYGPVLANLLDSSEQRSVVVDLRCGRDGVYAVISVLVRGSSICIAYDRDGQRADKCVIVDRDRTELPLEARRCPSWLMADAGGSRLYRVERGTAGVQQLLVHGWPHLDAAERLAVLYSVKEDLDRIPVAIQLIEGGNRSAIEETGPLFVSLTRHVPPDLRPAYNMWIERYFGTELGSQPLENGSSPRERAAAAVVAEIDEPGLAQKAVQVLAQGGAMWPDLAPSVYRLAASADRAIADRLLLEVRDRKHGSFSLDAVVVALSSSRFALELARDNMTWLPTDILKYLLLGRCDLASRNEVAKLVAHLPADRQIGVFAAIDRCMEKSKVLAPLFRRWLGPKPTTKAPRQAR